MTPTATALSRTETRRADPVKAVSVLSTGSVEIHPEHAYGTRKPLYWWLLTSRRWTQPRPINVYVIEHANGLVLFDTGQDRASVTDDAYFPGGVTGFLYDSSRGSRSAKTSRSPHSSHRSATPRATSTRPSCRTCTRITWVGSAS